MPWNDTGMSLKGPNAVVDNVTSDSATDAPSVKAVKGALAGKLSTSGGTVNGIVHVQHNGNTGFDHSQAWIDVGGTIRTRVLKDGGLVVSHNGSTAPTVAVQQTTGQTSNLQEWHTALGVTAASMSASGLLTANGGITVPSGKSISTGGIASSGGATVTGSMFLNAPTSSGLFITTADAVGDTKYNSGIYFREGRSSDSMYNRFGIRYDYDALADPELRFLAYDQTSGALKGTAMKIDTLGDVRLANGTAWFSPELGMVIHGGGISVEAGGLSVIGASTLESLTGYGNLTYHGGAPTFVNTGNVWMALDSPKVTYAGIQFKAAGKNRWAFGKQNSTETVNGGADLCIWRYDDNGNNFGSNQVPFRIARATGTVTIAALSSTPALMRSTSTYATALVEAPGPDGEVSALDAATPHIDLDRCLYLLSEENEELKTRVSDLEARLAALEGASNG